MAFVTTLQRAVARDDRATVVSLFYYPLTVFVAGLRIPVVGPEEAISRYDAIFTEELKSRLAATAVRPEAVTPDGLAIANGLIEIRTVDGRLLVSAITVPLGGPPNPPSAPPSPVAPDRSRAGRAAGPRRIVPRAGPAPTSVADRLQPGDIHTFVVYVGRGQVLEVRIQGVTGEAIVARILDGPRGKPLDQRAGTGVRTWTGRVAEPGDYYIEVRRQVGGSMPMSFALVVGVRP